MAAVTDYGLSNHRLRHRIVNSSMTATRYYLHLRFLNVTLFFSSLSLSLFRIIFGGVPFGRCFGFGGWVCLADAFGLLLASSVFQSEIGSTLIVIALIRL
ncbi:PREDICTED: uncharacterized protein LOC101306131 [Fragaria vesca subsp. vesca]